MLSQSDFDLSNLFLLFLHMMNPHASSIFFEICNSVAIFTCLNFLRISVTETSLPESYKIFSEVFEKFNPKLEE